MDNIKPIDFRDIKFERDTKVDYENGDAVVNSVFRLYDIDHSGDFNDSEWFNYLTIQQHIENRRENLCSEEMSNAQKYYRKQADKMLAELEKIEREYPRLSMEHFELLHEFENSHPNVYLMAKENEEDVPQGYKVYDIECFGIGYSEKYNSNLKYGYIEGLETLTPAERKEYLRILDKALKEAKQNREYEQKHTELVNEYIAMNDMPNYCAMNGITEKLSRIDETNALLKCKEIRTAENPFLQDLLKVEQEINTLHHKLNRTQADAEQLNRLYVQSQQLLSASRSWMFTDSDFDIGKYRSDQNSFFTSPEFIQAEGGIMLSQSIENSTNANFNSKGKYSLDGQNMGNEESLNSAYTTEFGIFSSKKDKSLMSNATITNFTQYPANKSSMQFNGNISTGRKFSGYDLNSGISVNVTENTNTFTPNISLRKGNYNLNINETVNVSNFNFGTQNHISDRPHFSDINNNNESQNNTSLMTSTNATLSYYSPKINSSITANISKSRQSYSGNVSKNFNYNTKEISVSAMPGLNTEYARTSFSPDMTNQSLNITTSFNGSMTYYNKYEDFGAKLCLNESYVMTFGDGNDKFKANNNLTLTGNLKYKNSGLAVQYNNSISTFNVTNTLGIQFQFHPNENTYLSLGYVYKNEKLPNESVNTKNILTAGGTIKFKPKKKKIPPY